MEAKGPVHARDPSGTLGKAHNGRLDQARCSSRGVSGTHVLPLGIALGPG